MTDLQRIFRDYNRKYFGGKLEECKVIWDRRIGKFDCMGEYDSEGPTISIAIELRRWPRQKRFTVLHEMVHALLFQRGNKSTQHGPAFEREMMKLAKKGAFRDLW